MRYNIKSVTNLKRIIPAGFDLCELLGYALALFLARKILSIFLAG